MEKLFVSKKDESVRMFKNPVLDKLSRVHFAVPIIIFVPVILFFLYRGIFVFHVPILQFLGLLAGGLLFWTVTEYVIHRFVFHYHPTSDLGKRMLFIFHGVHHDYPNDSMRLVLPPGTSIPLAFLFYGLFSWVFGNQAYVAPFYVGFVFGYLCYDMLHYAVHHVNTKNKLFNALKKHHMKHHYQEPDNGFGVSSVLWDKVFGTTYKK